MSATLDESNLFHTSGGAGKDEMISVVSLSNNLD
jgi:hypothetical protein